MAQRTPQVAGYARVSSKQQEDGDALANQQHALRQAGATLLFSDVVSGFNQKARARAAGFSALLDAIRSGQVSRLLVKDLTRAARRDVFVHELLTVCDQAGVEFLSLQTGRVSTGTAGEWLNVKMLLTFGEYFSRDLSDRIRRGQQSYIARGIPAFSSVTLPWHLQRDPSDRHKAIPAAGWADARHAVERYIAGEWSATQVAEFIYPRHGVLRTTSSVLSWLKCHGLRGHHGKQRGHVLISNCYPPLIDDQEAVALDRRIAQNKWGMGGKRTHSYSLSGICTCHHCGQRLVCCTTKNSTGKEYPYIRCNSPGCAAAKCRINHDRLQELLVFVRLAPELERIQDHREMAAAIQAPSAELLNARRRVQRLEAVLSEFDSPGVRQDLQQAKERLEALEPAAVRPTMSSGLARLRVGSDAWWAESSPAQRNTELLALVERAEVDLAVWKALPPPPPAGRPDDPSWHERHDAWQQGCAQRLIPVLQLR